MDGISSLSITVYRLFQSDWKVYEDDRCDRCGIFAMMQFVSFKKRLHVVEARVYVVYMDSMAIFLENLET